MTPEQVEQAKLAFVKAYEERLRLPSRVAKVKLKPPKVAKVKKPPKEASLVDLQEKRALLRSKEAARLPEQRIRALISNAIRRGKGTKTSSAVAYLGCSIADLINYLEAKFEPGMGWGTDERRLWHIDHIRPIASFDKNDPDWAYKANHYTNLQPLWALDNIAKGSKLRVNP